MNPLLSQNIAKQQQRVANEAVKFEQTEAEEASVAGLVRQIDAFKLGKKIDKRGERTGWFDSNNEQLIVDLQPSSDQMRFLSSVALKLRVMTTLAEGPTARSIDLFCFDSAESEHPSGHLFNSLALTPEDTGDDSHKLYVPTMLGPVVPGTSEFQDIEVLINSFSVR